MIKLPRLEECFHAVSTKGRFTDSALTMQWELAGDGDMNLPIAEHFSSELPVMNPLAFS